MEMKEYIGIKRIKAKEMNTTEYSKYMGMSVHPIEVKEGYMVEYIGSTGGNHKDHEGYVSWSPKKEFEEAYRELVESESISINASRLGELIKKERLLEKIIEDVIEVQNEEGTGTDDIGEAVLNRLDMWL